MDEPFGTVTPDSSDNEIEFSLEKRDYSLNCNKTKQKHHAALNRPDGVVITQTGGGFTLQLNSVMFHQVKDKAIVFYTDDSSSYTCHHTTVKDNKGKTVETKFKICSGKSHIYTLNLYHTKCTALVNGRLSSVFIDKDLPKLLDTIESDMNITGPSTSTTHVSVTTDETAVKSVIADEICGGYVSTPIPVSPVSVEPTIYSTLRDLQADMTTLTTLLQSHIVHTNSQFDLLRDDIKSVKSIYTVHNESTNLRIDSVQQTTELINSELEKSTNVLQRRMQSLSDSFKSQVRVQPSVSATSVPISDSSTISVPAQILQNPNSNVPINKKTLFIGDSLLKGINIKGLKNSVDVKTLPGAKSNQLLDQLNSMEVSKYENVIIHVGGNDVADSSTCETLRANLTNITSLLHSYSCKTYMCSLVPRVDVDVSSANRIIADVCHSSSSTLIDSYKAFVFGDGSVVRNFFYRDGIHLNNTGTSALLQTVNKLVQLLPTSSSNSNRTGYQYQRHSFNLSRRYGHFRYNNQSQYQNRRY